MEGLDWAAEFQRAPLSAIGMLIATGAWYFFQRRKEKAAEDVDNKEIERLQQALVAVIKERDEERARADGAFEKQLELTERFSDMRAQNERLLERMESMTRNMESMNKDMIKVLDENRKLQSQVSELSDKLQRLQSSIDIGSIT